MSESDADLIGRWEATLAQAGPDADPGSTFHPPGWGTGSGAGSALALPHFSFSAPLEADAPQVDAAQISGPHEATVQLPEGAGLSGSAPGGPTQAPPDDASRHETLTTGPEGTAQFREAEPSYRLDEVIGRGGMGVVYRAWQGSLRRSVALKRQLGHTDAATRRRFVAEAVATGRLDHPNVVPVYDLGTDPTGEVLLAMKLVDGVPWKTLLHPDAPEDRERAATLGLEDHLRILVQVCNAVAYAHSRSIVHNDLKPENVMLGEFGEVLVMDWGLAVQINEEPESPIPHARQLRAPCGTPAYMPPELADGDGARVGPWTDVYLLGSILHELVTGRAPHGGTTIHQVIAQAARSEPPDFPPEVPRELAEVCTRAMAREPEARYPGAKELRAALETYLTHSESHVAAAGAAAILERCDPAQLGHDQLYADLGEAIARYGQAIELWPENDAALEGRRRARLRYAEVALAHGDLGLAEAQLSYLTDDLTRLDDEAPALRVAISDARQAQAREQRARGRLRAALVAALGLIVAGLVLGLGLLREEAARTAARAAEAQVAREKADLARAEAEEARLRAEALAAESLVGQGDALLLGERPAEASARFRRARQLMTRLGRPTLAAELGLLSASRQAPRPLVVHRLHEGEARAARFGPTGRLYSAGADGAVRGLDPFDPQASLLASGLGPINALEVSPLGSWVAVGGEDGRVHLVATPGPGLRLLGTLPGRVLALAPAPSGRTLTAVGAGGAMAAWSLPEGEPVLDFPSHELGRLHLEDVTTVAATPNYLWTGGSEGRLIHWNTIRGAYSGASVHWDFSRRYPLFVAQVPLRSLTFSRDQPQLAFAVGLEAQVWHFTDKLTQKGQVVGNFNNFREHLRLTGHHAPVSEVAYVPGTTRLVSAGLDGRLLAWDVASETTWEKDADVLRPKPIAQAYASDAVTSISISPDASLVAAAQSDGSVSVWDLGLAEGIRSGAERSRQPLRFVVPPQPREPLERPRRDVSAVESEPPLLSAVGLGPAGDYAVSGALDGTLSVWDARGGRRLEQLAWHTQRILALHLSADRFLSVCAEGWVRTWSLEFLQPMSGAALGPASLAAVSSAGQHLALARADGSVDVFASQTGVLAWRYPGLGQAPLALALSPGGEAILVAYPGGKVRYQTRAGQGRDLSATQSISALAFAGAEALLGDERGGLSLRALPSGAEREQVRAHGAKVQAISIREDLLWTTGADGTWQLRRLVDLGSLRSFRPDQGSAATLAIDQQGTRVLLGRHELELWDLTRVERGAELERLVDVAAPEERDLALGRALLHQGQLDRGVSLLHPSQAPPDALQIALAAWELDRLQVAGRALAQAKGAAHPAYLALLERGLERELGYRGSQIGQLKSRVRSIWIAKDGSRAITGTEGGMVDLWDLELERRSARLLEHERQVTILKVSPDESRFAFGDDRGSCELWSLEPLRRLRRWREAKRGWVIGLCFSSDGRRLYATSQDRVLSAWSTDDGRLIGESTLPRELGYPSELVASPDGRYLAAADGRMNLVVWASADLSHRSFPYATRQERGGLYGLRFDPQRPELIAFRQHDRVWVRYSLEGELLGTTRAGAGYFSNAALSPDCSQGVAITAGRGEWIVTLWDLTRGEVVHSWEASHANLEVAFGPRGTILTGGTSGSLIQRRVPR